MQTTITKGEIITAAIVTAIILFTMVAFGTAFGQAGAHLVIVVELDQPAEDHFGGLLVVPGAGELRVDRGLLARLADDQVLGECRDRADEQRGCGDGGEEVLHGVPCR